jgi:hypothetical protein
MACVESLRAGTGRDGGDSERRKDPEREESRTAEERGGKGCELPSSLENTSGDGCWALGCVGSEVGEVTGDAVSGDPIIMALDSSSSSDGRRWSWFFLPNMGYLAKQGDVLGN